MFPRTIRTRLLVAFVLMVSVPAIAISTNSILVSYHGGKRQTLEQLNSVATLKEAEINVWLRDLQTDLIIVLSRQSAVQEMCSIFLEPPRSAAYLEAYHGVQDRFARFIKHMGRFDELALINLRGRVVVSTTIKDEGQYRGLQTYFKEGLKQAGIFVQTVSYSSASERVNAVVAVHPVTDQTGRVLGVLVGSASLARLNEIMDERAGLGGTGQTYLVGSNHVLLTELRSHGWSPGGTYLHTAGVSRAIDEHLNGSGVYRDYRGVLVYGVYRWLPKLQVALLAERDESEALKLTFSALRIDALVALISIIVAVLASLFVTRNIVAPLANLAKTAKRIAGGELDLAAEVACEDEIGALAQTFNSMTAQLRDLIGTLQQRVLELKHAEEKYRSIFENAVEGIFQTVPSGTFLRANPAMAQILGYDSAQDLIESCGDSGAECCVNPQDWKEFLRKLAHSGYATGFETQFYRKDGRMIRASLNARSVLDERGRILFIEGSCMDITERKRAEESLANEKERLSVTLRSIGDGVISTDTRGKIVLINKAAEDLTGWTQQEAIGRECAEIFQVIHEKTLEPCESPVEKVMRTGGTIELADHTVLVSRDGARRIIADSCAPLRDSQSRIVGVVLVFRDVTEKRKVEEELLRAEKLESIGILAGGIAHDFNNILTGVLGNLSLAMMLTRPGDKAFRRLVKAEKATLRARDLTQQLLTFSKGGSPVKKTACIVELLKDSAAFMLSGSNVRSEFSIAEDLWPIEVDEGQMSQVINNLIINANQAMPDGGTLRITAENSSAGPEDGFGGGDRKYVRIAIEDRGCGIPEEDLPRIFDPYFTTKEGGSGLGLATAYAIVKKHDGLITVASEVGRGTTFSIYLPASETAAPASLGPNVGAFRGRGKILVMDDEEIIRDVAGEMLIQLGYEVALVRDGAEAIAQFQQAKAEGAGFDALIMDLTIPGGMGGREAIRRLLEIDPAVKGIVSSGYSNDPIMSHFRDYGFVGVVTKPYKAQELSEILHGVLFREEDVRRANKQ